MSTPRLPYFEQNCELTLREAVKIHIANLPKNGVTIGFTDEKLARLFEGHDTCHVVFGCSTSLVDEGLVDTWSLFGSTVTLRQYWDYMNYPEVTRIITDAFKSGGVLNITWLYLKATPLFLRAFARALLLRPRWPYFGHETYLDWKLKDVRSHFGIRVLDRADRGP